MKTYIVFCIISITMFSCGKNNYSKGQKHQKTPSSMVMTHDEKMDVNYDARENRKIIEKNLANKETSMKDARKQKQKQTEDLKELNENSSKVKKKKKVEKYNFY